MLNWISDIIRSALDRMAWDWVELTMQYEVQVNRRTGADRHRWVHYSHDADWNVSAWLPGVPYGFHDESRASNRDLSDDALRCILAPGITIVVGVDFGCGDHTGYAYRRSDGRTEFWNGKGKPPAWISERTLITTKQYPPRL